MASLRNKLTSLFTAFGLFFTFLAAIPLTFSFPSSAQAVNPVCSSTMSASAAGLKAVPAHGKVFYVDSGVTPKVDAAYVGYRIVNSSGSTKTGLWVSIESFVGGKMSLANPSDQYQQMDPITNTNYKTAFYLLKATGSTTAAQTHTIKVFDRRPDLTGATSVMICDFTFSAIKETIKANANKVTSVTGLLSPTTATLGGTLTISVAGDTGKVGAGQSPDGSIIWVSPAAVSTWPTRSLRLESTSIVLDCQNPVADITLVDTLIQSTADTCFTTANGSWTGSYVFRIIGPGPSALTPSPIANIASGTQYKHSDIAGLSFGAGINLSGVASSAFRVNVVASSTPVSSTSSTARVRYTITLSTTSSTAVEVDEIVDRAAAGTSYVTGSSTLNGTTISDPAYLTSEANISPLPAHYIGPFSVVSGSNVVITFDREIPCTSTPTTYSNTSFAKTGDQLLGESSTQIPGVTVTTTSGVSSCTVNVADNPQTIAPITQTLAATSVTSSTATLNGYSNAYGGTSVTSYFRYSRDRNLATSVTSTSPQSITGSSTTNVTQSISGLQSSTTYYFQIAITSPTTPTTFGAILSFTTDAVQAVPTVVTSAATTVLTTSATLNGYLNPNLTALTGVQFIYGRSSSFPSNVTVAATGSNGASTITVSSSAGIVVGMSATGTRIGADALVTGVSGTTITLSVANTGAVSTNVTFSGTTTTALQMDDGAGNLVAMTLSGSGQTDVSLALTGLSSATKYYFKLRGTCAVNATYCPNGFVDGVTLNFTTGAPNVITRDATLVSAVTATINGNVQQAANSDTWSFIYCAYNASSCNASGISSGTITTAVSQGNTTVANVSVNLTGLTAGTLYYFQVLGYTTASSSTPISSGAVLSFETLIITTSSTLGSGAEGSSYSASVQGTGGSGSYVWTATSGLPAGLSISESGLISGTPTTAGTYNAVVIRMYDPYYDTYIEKTFTIVISAPVFTVTFRSNYGVEITSTQSANTTTNLTANSFTRTGYTFIGWNTLAVPNGGGTSYSDEAPYNFTSNVTLFAQWQINQYAITFNANTGTYVANSTPKTASLDYNSNALTQVPENPTKTGHTLLGWNTSSTATTALSSYLVPANTATLFAVWSKNSYSITFDASTNGGVFGSSPIDTQTVSVEFELNALNYAPANPTKAGQSFLGWNTDPTATTALNSYPVGSSTATLYAIYVAGPVYFTVTFDGNSATSGSPSSNSQTQTTSGGSINLATVGTLQKTHYTFVGWSLTGSGTPISGTTYIPSSNVTLLAIWTPVSYTLSYVAGTGGTITGTSTQSILYGSDGSSVTATANTGYQFVNWSDGSTSNSRTDTNIQANATYTANFQLISYTITYDFNYSGAPIAETKTLNHFVDALSSANRPTDPTRSGYNFAGWSESNSGTIISTFTIVGAKTFYAQWTVVSNASTPTPRPVYVPNPPTITSISVPEMCAIGEQLIVKGTYLTGATATLDGVKVRIGNSSFNELVLLLPAAPFGRKNIVVTNVDGSANTTIEYKFIDSPVYVNFIYPSTYQDMAFTYTFTATNTEKYSIDGVLPPGLTLNPLTGEISGTPTKAGNYLFTIVASNFCDQTYLDVYMFVDKAIPQTYTCSVPFLSPRSDTVSEFRLTQLRKCLDDIYTLSPATVAPVIFISGGLRTGLTIEQSLTHPRYLPILDLIVSMNVNAQIYLGAFSGTLDSVQLIVYWPMP